MISTGEQMNNKWAVILGASSGFGSATALELARKGLNIVGVHLDRKSTLANVDKLKTQLDEIGVSHRFFNVNAADEEKRTYVLNEISDLKESIWVLMHSIAFGALKPFTDANDPISPKQIEMTLDVMAHSLIYWARDLVNNQYFSPQGGRIFTMTSAGSSRMWPSYGAVSAAKCALESHTRQLAIELATKKISANSILAGVTNTAALKKIPGNEDMIKWAESTNPSGRMTTPEDIAQMIAQLSYPGLEFCTGNVIRVDGGENIMG